MFRAFANRLSRAIDAIHDATPPPRALAPPLVPEIMSDFGVPDRSAERLDLMDSAREAFLSRCTAAGLEIEGEAEPFLIAKTFHVWPVSGLWKKVGTCGVQGYGPRSLIEAAKREAGKPS